MGGAPGLRVQRVGNCGLNLAIFSTGLMRFGLCLGRIGNLDSGPGSVGDGLFLGLLSRSPLWYVLHPHLLLTLTFYFILTFFSRRDHSG